MAGAPQVGFTCGDFSETHRVFPLSAPQSAQPRAEIPSTFLPPRRQALRPAAVMTDRIFQRNAFRRMVVAENPPEAPPRPEFRPAVG